LSFTSDPVGTFYWIWHDWQFVIEACVVAIPFILYLILRRRAGHKFEPMTDLDEFDKSGVVKLYEISDEQEGAVLLMFERSNGDIENRRIGQPFTFHLEDGNIERHHLNARGSYDCINPPRLFKDYVPDIKEINLVNAETTQQYRELRTGGYQLEKEKRKLRTLMLIFVLACMIGVGLAGAFHR